MTQGVLLFGEFVAIAPEKPYTRRDGTTVEPVRLKVLAGESVLGVEFESREAALGVLGGEEPVKGTSVIFPVFVSGPWQRDAETGFRSRGPVFFEGKRSRP